MSGPSRSHLIPTFEYLLTTGEYSDLTVTCGSDAYRVHKAVVCTQSGFFRKAVSFPMGKEAAESHIDLKEDDPAIVACLMEYFYASSYHFEPPEPRYRLKDALKDTDVYHYQFPHTCAYECWDHKVCPHHTCGDKSCNALCNKFVCNECTIRRPVKHDPTRLLKHSKMYQIADKYDVLSLKQNVQHRFTRACKIHWDEEQFIVAAAHVLSSTPEQDEGLRSTIREVITKRDELLQNAKLVALVTDNPTFAMSIIQRQAARMKRFE